MEHHTIESILQSLGLDSYLKMFEENDLDYELLRDLSEEKLEKALNDIGLPLGKQLKIAKRIQESKYQCTLIKEIDLQKQTLLSFLRSRSSR